MATVAALEKRVARVEKELAQLKRVVLSPSTKPDWFQKIAGSFRDDPDFGEILRLGREFRRSDSRGADSRKT